MLTVAEHVEAHYLRAREARNKTERKKELAASYVIFGYGVENVRDEEKQKKVEEFLNDPFQQAMVENVRRKYLKSSRAGEMMKSAWRDLMERKDRICKDPTSTKEKSQPPQKPKVEEKKAEEMVYVHYGDMKEKRIRRSKLKNHLTSGWSEGTIRNPGSASKDLQWWTNGEFSVQCDSSPGRGWRKTKPPRVPRGPRRS